MTAEFYYDGKNRQIARNIHPAQSQGGGVIRFSAWDGWELVQEYGSGLSVATGYLQGSTGVIKSWSASGTIYYYQDKLGSTTHVANASGQLVESYKYDLYGTPSYYLPNDSSPHSSSTYNVVDLYGGERWIPELSVYDLRNRFMSPELGRFLQADPIGFKGDASNLYRYCGNDSVDRNDPMGLIDTSSAIWQRQRLFDTGSSSLAGLEELEKQFSQQSQPVGLIMATIDANTGDSKSGRALDPRLQHFDIPGAIGKLEGAVGRYRHSEVSHDYPDPQKVVDAIKKALREGRIQVGQPSDFRKDNPVSSRNNVIFIDATARVNYREFPSVLAHDGQHIADRVHENDRGFHRERRAYDVQYGFGLFTGSTRPRVTDDQIRSWYNIPKE